MVMVSTPPGPDGMECCSLQSPVCYFENTAWHSCISINGHALLVHNTCPVRLGVHPRFSTHRQQITLIPFASFIFFALISSGKQQIVLSLHLISPSSLALLTIRSTSHSLSLALVLPGCASLSPLDSLFHKSTHLLPHKPPSKCSPLASTALPLASLPKSCAPPSAARLHPRRPAPAAGLPTPLQQARPSAQSTASSSGNPPLSTWRKSAVSFPASSPSSSRDPLSTGVAWKNGSALSEAVAWPMSSSLPRSS